MSSSSAPTQPTEGGFAPVTVTSKAGYKLQFAATLSEQTSCVTTTPPGQKCVIAKVNFANGLTDRSQTVYVNAGVDNPWEFNDVMLFFPAKDAPADGIVSEQMKDPTLRPSGVPKVLYYDATATCPNLDAGIGDCTGDNVVLPPSGTGTVYVELVGVPESASLSDFKVYAGTVDHADLASGNSRRMVAVPLTN